LFSVFVALAFLVVAVLTVRAGIAASEVAFSPKAVLVQRERHPAGASSSAAVAEQARLEYRRGEWSAGNSGPSAPDVEQARIGWRARASMASAQDRAGRFGSSITSRDASQARWLAQHGGTGRTCVLLCGGR
jgi:hypothetical protein